jgi:RNA polymerase sigma factor (sigma-70 family)
VNVIRGHRRTETRRLRALARAPWPDGTGSEGSGFGGTGFGGTRFGSTGAGGSGFEDRVVERVSAERLRPALARALGTLSAAERDLFLLVAWADLSYDQAALALGIPTGTARSRLARLRVKLRKSLDIEGESR